MRIVSGVEGEKEEEEEEEEEEDEVVGREGEEGVPLLCMCSAARDWRNTVADCCSPMSSSSAIDIGTARRPARRWRIVINPSLRESIEDNHTRRAR